MKQISYKYQRDEELIRAFYDNLGGGRTVLDAISLAAQSPCSRFWVSPTQAFKMVSSMRRNRWYGKGRPAPIRIQRTLDIMERCGGDYSMDKITEVVYSGAPQFYLSTETAKRYIYAAIRRRKKGKKRHDG